MSVVASSWILSARTEAVVDEVAQTQSPSAVLAFNVLSATGLLLLVAILLTAALSRSVYRVATWYTYVFAWIVYCITPFPILGHQTKFDTPPGHAACLADAALMYASRPYAGFATLALLLQLYVTVSTRLRCKELPRYFVTILMIFPPVMFVAVVLGILIAGLRNPEIVELEPGGFYCHLAISEASTACAVLVLLITAGLLALQIMTFVLLCRQWRAFRALQRRNEPGVSLSIIVRVSAFAMIPLIGLVLSTLTYVPTLVARVFVPYNLVLALLPLSAAVIFGSQTDILDVWIGFFWKKAESTGQASEKTAGFSEVGTFSTINSA